MAWTTPRTWTDGELVTAALLNTHVRDNLNAAGMHLIARKTATESVASNTTPQADDHLLFSVAANEIWYFELFLMGYGTVNFRYNFSLPTSYTGISLIHYGNSTGATAEVLVAGYTGNPTTQLDILTARTAVPPAPFGVVRGVFTNGANAGTFQFQWAQATSSATALNLAVNSTLWGVKLA